MREFRSIGCSPSVSVWFALCRMKYYGATGNSVIRALPLALDFNATLRCPMAESWVATGQRAVAIFAQEQEPNGRLLVRGCMSYFICKAAGQAVHRALRRIHRHVELFALHPVRHQRSDADLAIARNELD